MYVCYMLFNKYSKISTLSKLTRRLHSSAGTDNLAYLQLRVSKLNEFERTVLLIIDEIYIARRVEYSAGEVQGLTADGTVASTLLCFTVKSMVSKYKDIVAIYPMDKLTAVKQHQSNNDVMTLLRMTDLNVVAISVDNASTNRKFFIDCLCNGTLTTSVVDSVTQQPIFLVFDPVHTIKNIYNNFQSRKIFACPQMEHNLPTGCSANFQHIAELFSLESTMALKKAHRLTSATLHPKSIKKTSVKLAVSVFCESTRDALWFYIDNEGRSSWADTADFVSLIVKLWNVLNVKSCSKGKHKRDFTMDPVRSSIDWKLEFLREVAQFCQRWEQSHRPGLSKETFLVLRHTCVALVECASYLLDRRGFQYVLLGNIVRCHRVTIWLAASVGRRQLLCLQWQVMQGDRKIRAMSLLKFSQMSLSDIDGMLLPTDSETQSPLDRVADSIADAIDYTHWPSSSDANIIFYVRGAIARSAVRTTNCDSYKDLLVNPDTLQPINVDETLDYSASVFLDSVNRGGLTRPTEYTFLLCVHCWRVFEEIRSSLQLKAEFLGAGCQRLLFTKIIDRMTSSQPYGDGAVGDNYCMQGHDLKQLVVSRFFNCVAKNLVKQLTSTASNDGLQAKSRKVAKLQSASHA